MIGKLSVCYVDSVVLSLPLRGELEKLIGPLDDAVDEADGGPTEELLSPLCLLKSNCLCCMVKSNIEAAAAIFSTSDRGDCCPLTGGDEVGDGGVLRIASV